MTNIIKNNLFLIGIILFLTSCGAKVYNAPDIKQRTTTPSRIAILPPTITMLSGQFTGTFEQSKETESLHIQQAMFSWFLKQMGKSRIPHQMQDIETTNAKLKQAGYPEKTLTKEELCQILDVDALVSSHYTLSKPMPQSVAIATSILLDYEGTTNKILATMNIFDNKTHKVIWSYSNDFSGTWRETYHDIVDKLMRNASKKLPYGS
ncbi:hypothetical protein [Capnocytophaga catalasegens]|uniref:DUF4136 domain-containing protein n=1 Tax=Capnocytophaga catalasegens TaxID=1004260 RepID=A0AAV5AUC8_9FLAO|nr:hypothetical protein [Capnocytophaga catalasegens]GIZ15381.1 hypothetical protein RCZ03_13810 [Capnocytophaga catalasegens]GJM50969.1 hypothetical protein RCZ15_19420 [Capnocytophaga catalasegens]GJM52153.1 hypothetical protein RCZ16_04710 [Capnocytophaga catalasegens]